MLPRDRKAAAFADARQFVWRVTEPFTNDSYLPARIYNPVAVRVGGNVVLLCSNHLQWNRTHVVFYNISEHSWSAVNGDGPDRPLSNPEQPTAGLVGDKLYFIDTVEFDLMRSFVHCFDLLLREWIPLDVDRITVDESASACCFMDSIESFIYWDADKGPSVRVLELPKLQWREYKTKGELPTDLWSRPIVCGNENRLYLTWNDDNRTKLYILANRSGKFYWSKPVVSGFRPNAVEEGTLTYAAGRLFMFGGFDLVASSLLHIYSIEMNEWHNVEYNSTAAYNVTGTPISAASHCAVALDDKLMVFGGLSMEFKNCRILEPALQP